MPSDAGRPLVPLSKARKGDLAVAAMSGKRHGLLVSKKIKSKPFGRTLCGVIGYGANPSTATDRCARCAALMS